jgi:hypothetical protein
MTNCNKEKKRGKKESMGLDIVITDKKSRLFY